MGPPKPLDANQSATRKLKRLKLGCKLTSDRFIWGGHCKRSMTMLSAFVVALLLFKWANPSLFYCLFQSFQTNIITIFSTNMCEKCPLSIRCRDSNPQPWAHESPSIPIRRGLPPLVVVLFDCNGRRRRHSKTSSTGHTVFFSQNCFA